MVSGCLKVLVQIQKSYLTLPHENLDFGIMEIEILVFKKKVHMFLITVAKFKASSMFHLAITNKKVANFHKM